VLDSGVIHPPDQQKPPNHGASLVRNRRRGVTRIGRPTEMDGRQDELLMTDDKSDDFDTGFAAELLGAHVLVGVTDMNQAGEVVGKSQFHGRVIKAHPTEGVILVDATGHEHWLPPRRASYEPADPGEYRLRSTGEIVVDPDYLTTWIRYPPDRH
jgi:hypothetical protein